MNFNFTMIFFCVEKIMAWEKVEREIVSPQCQFVVAKMTPVKKIIMVTKKYIPLSFRGEDVKINITLVYSYLMENKIEKSFFSSMKMN